MPYMPAPQSTFSKQVSDCNDCLVLWQGCVPYSRALDLQMQICQMKKGGFEKDVLLLLEHPPTITMGRSGKLNHLLIKEEDLNARGIAFWNVDRGGDVTFHGPGQLVGYPILDLAGLNLSVSGYIRGLEEMLIRTLAVFDVAGERLEGFPGVWSGQNKVAAIGVRVNARRISSHGFALNINNDLSYFSHIVPCGLRGKGVTSLTRLAKRDIPLNQVMKEIVHAFGEVFGVVMSEENRNPFPCHGS